jgi:hypothetical protein
MAPFIKVNGRLIGTGKPGPLTKKLAKGFKEVTANNGTPIYPKKLKYKRWKRNLRFAFHLLWKVILGEVKRSKRSLKAAIIASKIVFFKLIGM